MDADVAARERFHFLFLEHYEGQVVEFPDQTAVQEHGSEAQFREIQNRVLTLLTAEAGTRA